jgi:hypothetical protein
MIAMIVRVSKQRVEYGDIKMTLTTNNPLSRCPLSYLLDGYDLTGEKLDCLI